jgi:hypothetical protein
LISKFKDDSHLNTNKPIYFVIIKSKLISEGKQIYSEKKHLIAGVPGQPKVTWSQDEYAHPGMQIMYLKLKSFQRFTETWAMLERSARLGLFDVHRNQQFQQQTKSVRVISIGGGPGYELISYERFFRRCLKLFKKCFTCPHILFFPK